MSIVCEVAVSAVCAVRTDPSSVFRTLQIHARGLEVTATTAVTAHDGPPSPLTRQRGDQGVGGANLYDRLRRLAGNTAPCRRFGDHDGRVLFGCGVGDETSWTKWRGNVMDQARSRTSAGRASMAARARTPGGQRRTPRFSRGVRPKPLISKVGGRADGCGRHFAYIFLVAAPARHPISGASRSEPPSPDRRS